MTPEMTEWLKDRMDRIEDKLDVVTAHCNNIDKTLAVNTADISVHIKRTDGLQDMVNKFRAHLTMLHGIAWFVGFVGTVLGVAKYFSLV